MSKLYKVIGVVFLLFVIWIIFSADTGRKNIFFNFVSITPYGDKLGHFFLFGFLAFLMNLTLNFKKWLRIPLGTVLVSIFVLLEELSQAFFPNRTMDIADLIADGLGILVFTYISYRFRDNVIEIKE